MHSFVKAYRASILGVLSFFDRVLFRGCLLRLSRVDGLDSWLAWKHILLKNFEPFVQEQSRLLKDHAENIAKAAGRPSRYLGSAGESKEKWAQGVVERDKITEGLVGLLRIVEPCMSFTVRRNPEAKKLELVYGERKCLFLYFYFVDREFGLIHVRLQTWFPFQIQVCINGREWLARRFDRAGIKYEKSDNCFRSIENPEKAQEIADKLLDTNWQETLDRFAKRVNPLLKNVLAGMDYYWSIRQSEFATDVMFKSAKALADAYPGFVRYAMDSFGSEEVLRFLGRELPGKSEVTSELTRRPEGLRIRHKVEENSIKMYDKQGSVLRIETTINNPRRFMTYRRNSKGEFAWLRMRKGVADALRRARVSFAANSRYLEALATVVEKETFCRLLDPVSKPTKYGEARVRPLRPISRDDASFFAIVMRAEFLMSGFRNADVRNAFFKHPAKRGKRARKQAGQITRLIRLLRAHRLATKIPGTSRYRPTKNGMRVMGAALMLRKAKTEILSMRA